MDSPDRSWPAESDMRLSVEGEFGEILDALAAIRDRAYLEVEGAGISEDQLYGSERGFILPIYLRSISYLDSIRILCERGYGEEAFGLVRSLYEAEIDSYVLFAGDKPEILNQYADFELYELAMTASRGLDARRLPESEEVDEAVASRRAELRARLELRGKEIPDGFDDLSLMHATKKYAKLIYGDSSPPNWRKGLTWKQDVIPMVSHAQIRILSPGLETDDPERFAASVAERATEHEIAYPLMSAEIHGSPATIADRVRTFRVAGNPNEIPKTAAVAASHFFRLRVLVRDLFEIEGDEGDWLGLLRAVGLGL